MKLKIEIPELSRLSGKFTKISQLNNTKAHLLAAGVHVEGKISEYPPVNPGLARTAWEAAGGFVSDRQRRHYFWMLKNNMIEVPYRRGISPGSEDLGQSWTVTKERGGLDVVVGNDTSYGPYVQGADTQSKMHELIGWKTDQQVMDEEREAVVDFVRDGVKKDLTS